MKNQLFELATARMISLKNGGELYSVLYLAVRDFSMFEKYGSTTFHHAMIRCIVRSSQGALSGLPFMISSIVSEQCRLYGVIRSGSSWCIRSHDEHFIRLMYKFTLLPSLFISFRIRQPRLDNASPHTGQ
jgi:hypothetical protein